MNTNSRYKVNIPNIVHETIDGETIILNLKNGNYFSLDGIGRYIWDCIAKGISLSDIINRLQSDYGNENSDIASKINTFVIKLQEEDLIVPDANDGSQALYFPDEQVKDNLKESAGKFSAPVLNKYSDMKDLLILDPIHDVDETGWPTRKAE